MFEIKEHKTIVKDLQNIEDNFFSMLKDGPVDILYTGTNKYGNRLLGSIVFEDDDNNYLRYFHCLVSDTDFNLFTKQKISLRDVLMQAGSFFVIDRKYNGDTIDVNLISYNEVPDDFLPLATSFCPPFAAKPTFEYIFSLKGGIADVHKAEPEVVNAMNTTFSNFLRSSSQFLRELNIVPHIFSEPAQVGSFELTYKIELNEVSTLFSQPFDDIVKFLSNFYNYLFNTLPTEDSGLLKSDKVDSMHFNEMMLTYQQIFETRGAKAKNSEQELIDLISYSAVNLKEIDYKGFDRVEVINKIENANVPLAVIDNKFYATIENKFFQPEELEKPDVFDTDEKPTLYKVQVVSLNLESGNGKIYVENAEGGVIKIPLRLKGKANYQNTIFTKNMDEKVAVYMEVEAIGTRRNGDLIQIAYTFS